MERFCQTPKLWFFLAKAINAKYDTYSSITHITRGWLLWPGVSKRSPNNVQPFGKKGQFQPELEKVKAEFSKLVDLGWATFHETSLPSDKDFRAKITTLGQRNLEFIKWGLKLEARLTKMSVKKINWFDTTRYRNYPQLHRLHLTICTTNTALYQWFSYC